MFEEIACAKFLAHAIYNHESRKNYRRMAIPPKTKLLGILAIYVMSYIKNIPTIMSILEKQFNYTERTTLNRMRKEKADPYKILISCLLSLRSRDETTERISNELFQIADTPDKLIKIPLKRLEGIIYSTGHYHKKALTLKYVSNEIINKFNGKVPDKKEDLMSIKGIGPKTANIVLNFAYNQLVLPIDTHCHRIPNRLGWIKTKTPEQTEKE